MVIPHGSEPTTPWIIKGESYQSTDWNLAQLPIDPVFEEPPYRNRIE
jgi:hypothetical protein